MKLLLAIAIMLQVQPIPDDVPNADNVVGGPIETLFNQFKERFDRSDREMQEMERGFLRGLADGFSELGERVADSRKIQREERREESKGLIESFRELLHGPSGPFNQLAWRLNVLLAQFIVALILLNIIRNILKKHLPAFISQYL